MTTIEHMASSLDACPSSGTNTIQDEQGKCLEKAGLIGHR